MYVAIEVLNLFGIGADLIEKKIEDTSCCSRIKLNSELLVVYI